MSPIIVFPRHHLSDATSERPPRARLYAGAIDKIFLLLLLLWRCCYARHAASATRDVCRHDGSAPLQRRGGSRHATPAPRRLSPMLHILMIRCCAIAEFTYGYNSETCQMPIGRRADNAIPLAPDEVYGETLLIRARCCHGFHTLLICTARC